MYSSYLFVAGRMHAEIFPWTSPMHNLKDGIEDRIGVQETSSEIWGRAIIRR